MVVQANFSGKSKTVAVYEIDAGNNVTFKVVLKESTSGSRCFEIVLSQNASADYSEALNHPFYKEFVLPWVYKEKEVAEQTRTSSAKVVSLSDFRKRNNDTF